MSQIHMIWNCYNKNNVIIGEFNVKGSHCIWFNNNSSPPIFLLLGAFSDFPSSSLQDNSNFNYIRFSDLNRWIKIDISFFSFSQCVYVWLLYSKEFLVWLFLFIFLFFLFIFFTFIFFLTVFFSRGKQKMYFCNQATVFIMFFNLLKNKYHTKLQCHEINFFILFLKCFNLVQHKSNH